MINPFTNTDTIEQNPFAGTGTSNPFTGTDEKPLNPVELHERAVATVQTSTELEIPLVDADFFHKQLSATSTERNAWIFDTAMRITPLMSDSEKQFKARQVREKDARKKAGTFDPFDLEPQGMQIGAAPEPTTWEGFKKFFVGDTPSLQPNASNMEKFDRVFDTIVGSPLRVGLKLVKGRTLRTTDLMWAAVKRSVPEDVWVEEVKNMTLDEATDWAAGYNPSGFQKAVGTVAQFYGALRTVKPLLGRALGIKSVDVLGKRTFLDKAGEKVVETFWKGTKYPDPEHLSWLSKAVAMAYSFGTVSSVDQIEKQTLQKIDPSETEYGYEGAAAPLRDMAMGFIFSLAGSGSKSAWKSIWTSRTPTEQSRALKVLGLQEGATQEEITKAANGLLMVTHPDKAKGYIEQAKGIIAARDVLRAGEQKDIVFRGAKVKVTGKLLEGGKVDPSVLKTAIKPVAKPTATQEAAGIRIEGNALYRGDELLFEGTQPLTAKRIDFALKAHGIEVPEGAVLAGAEAITPQATPDAAKALTQGVASQAEIKRIMEQTPADKSVGEVYGLRVIDDDAPQPDLGDKLDPSFIWEEEADGEFTQRTDELANGTSAIEIKSVDDIKNAIKSSGNYFGKTLVLIKGESTRSLAEHQIDPGEVSLIDPEVMAIFKRDKISTDTNWRSELNQIAPQATPEAGGVKQPREMTREEFNNTHALHGTTIENANAIMKSGEFRGGSFVSASDKRAVQVTSEAPASRHKPEVIVVLQHNRGEVAYDQRGEAATTENSIGLVRPIAIIPKNVDPHKYLVQDAQSRGETIPPEVLAEYLDLAPTVSGTPITPENFRSGKAIVPQTAQDVMTLAKYAVQHASAQISNLGDAGKELVTKVTKADEVATMRAGQSNEAMHDAIKGLSKQEKASFGQAVNGIAYERLPLSEQERGKWADNKDSFIEPISDAQRAAAEKYLEIADEALAEASGLGFERTLPSGKKIKAEGGGMPWPQRLNKAGEKWMEKALRAMTGNDELDLKALLANDLVRKMIDRGIADGPADAYNQLKFAKEQQRRFRYGMFEGTKIPLPAEYTMFDSHDILGQAYWKNMFMQIEMAKNLGGQDYSKASGLIAKIKEGFGDPSANEVQQWMDRITGVNRLGKTDADLLAERIAGGINAYQTLKLSPATSLQNWFQPLIGLTEYDPRDVFKGLIQAYMPGPRKLARQSGAIPHDPFQTSIAADFVDAEKGQFMQKVARAWAWAIGMSTTEKGNNYKSAIMAASSALRDLAKLQQQNTKLGQLVKNILSMGGDSPGAIKRRMARHDIDWEEALKRGYLTPEEINIASQRGSKRSNFRSDLFTTPLWWQKSPWMRMMSKYKIPFAYNYTQKMWEAAGEALKHGNMKPALAFIAVTTMTGEIYNYLFREKILGESREDQSAAKRLWEDLKAGAGLGIFGALMFGYDARSTLWNFVAGPSGKTVDNVLRTYEDIKTAPEHSRDHLQKLYEREFPVGKYINQIMNRPQHQADVDRWKIRELQPDKDNEKFFYGEDMYDALRFDDYTGAMIAVHQLNRLGAEKTNILAAMNAKRVVKVSAKDRAEWEAKLTPKQLELVRREEASHVQTVAKAQSLLNLGEVDPKLTDFYVKLDTARKHEAQARLAGQNPKEALSIEDLTVIAVYSKISPILNIYEKQMQENPDEQNQIYKQIRDLYDLAIRTTEQ